MKERITAAIDSVLTSTSLYFDTCGPFPRQPCCNKKRKFYCPVCSKLLLPPPPPPASPQFPLLTLPEVGGVPERFPFKVDVILHDDRDVATGCHLPVMSSNCKIYEYEATSPSKSIPNYADLDDFENTYVLFPGPDAVPISKVAHKIKRLVVMDCKWTRTVSCQDSRISTLQRVTLLDPPDNSRYWRWHGKGDGMLSTIEATFAAAWEVNETINCGVGDFTGMLGGVFTIFGLQRRALELSMPVKKEGKDGGGEVYAPWEEGFKNAKRKERKQEGTERQKKQRIESSLKSKEDRRNEGKEGRRIAEAKDKEEKQARLEAGLERVYIRQDL